MFDGKTRAVLMQTIHEIKENAVNIIAQEKWQKITDVLKCDTIMIPFSQATKNNTVIQHEKINKIKDLLQ